MFNFRK